MANPLTRTIGTSATTVTLDSDVSEVAVFNRHASALVAVRTDGTQAALNTDGNYHVPAGVRRVIPVTTAGVSVVKLISDTAGTLVEIEVAAT